MNEQPVSCDEQQLQNTSHFSLNRSVFSFNPCQFKTNKLLNKQLPSIEVDVNANTITCKDSQAETSIARATNPLSTTNTVTYFQVEIHKSAAQSGVNVGLIGRDNSTRTLAGKSINSVGFITNQIFCNKKKIAQVEGAKQKDRIGCGINCLTMTFFFTKNRKMLHKNIPIPQNWTEFYPAAGAQNQNQCVKCYFQKHLFAFDIDAYILQIQKDIKEAVDEEETKVSDMYSLISEYMLFNGYTKTYELMNQKKDQIGFVPVKKLTKNPFFNQKIQVKVSEQIEDEEDSMIDELQGQEQADKIYESRLNQKLRQRFKSNVQPQMLMEVEQSNVNHSAIRKSTQNQIQIPQQVNFRKQSYVSNFSLLEDDQQFQNQIKNSKKQNKKEEKLKMQKLTASQKFLLTQRLDIIQLIKHQKIEYAYNIIQNKIPKIFQCEELLSIYLKAHIFLRKVKQQGALFAINYARQQPQFKKYQDRLIPAYNFKQQKVDEVPLKKIFATISVSKNGQINDFLRSEQFEAFAQYINSILMKHMGIMEDCRLGLWIEHLRILQRKTKDFKGMACGIQLNI